MIQIIRAFFISALMALVIVSGASSALAKQSKDGSDECEVALIHHQENLDLFLTQLFPNFLSPELHSTDLILKSEMKDIMSGLRTRERSELWRIMGKTSWVNETRLYSEHGTAWGQFRQYAGEIELLEDLKNHWIGRMVWIHEFQHAVDWVSNKKLFYQTSFRRPSVTYNLETRAFRTQYRFMQKTICGFDVEPSKLDFTDDVNERAYKHQKALRNSEGFYICDRLFLRPGYRRDILKEVGFTKFFFGGFGTTAGASMLIYIWENYLKFLGGQ